MYEQTQSGRSHLSSPDSVLTILTPRINRAKKPYIVGIAGGRLRKEGRLRLGFDTFLPDHLTPMPPWPLGSQARVKIKSNSSLSLQSKLLRQEQEIGLSLIGLP